MGVPDDFCSPSQRMQEMEVKFGEGEGGERKGEKEGERERERDKREGEAKKGNLVVRTKTMKGVYVETLKHRGKKE